MQSQERITLFSRVAAAVLGVCAILFVVSWVTFARQTDGMAVDILDVGQGDGIVIRTPGQQTIVIDGGPSDDFSAAVSRRVPFYDRTIDLVLLTHPHEDHIHGLVNLFSDYSVRRVAMTGVVAHNETYSEFLRLIKQQGIPIDYVYRGKEYDFGQGVRMRILAPAEDFSGKKVDDLNDSSIVATLQFNTVDFLFTGDAGEGVERDILATGDPVDVEILKVGHHGSRFSSSEEFLDATSPDVALISDGKNNRYKHPHDELIDRLIRRGIPTYRTDLTGDIEVWTDGNTYSVTP